MVRGLPPWDQEERAVGSDAEGPCSQGAERGPGASRLRSRECSRGAAAERTLLGNLGSPQTHREEGFLKNQEGPREADDQEWLSPQEAEENALNGRGNDQLRDPN